MHNETARRLAEEARELGLRARNARAAGDHDEARELEALAGVKRISARILREDDTQVAYERRRRARRTGRRGSKA